MNVNNALNFLAINESKYRNLLIEECKELDAGNDRYLQLRCMADATRVRIATGIHTAAVGQRAELVYAGATRDDAEEYILRVQGYVVRSHLPPISAKTQLGDNPRQASQSVTISGLGCTAFEKSVQGTLEVYTHFCRHLPKGQVHPWEPATFNGQLALTFTNRYFATPDEAIGKEDRELGMLVDPLNILRDAVPRGVHTVDNEVVYHERVTLDSGKVIHPSINPTGIAEGYLVEVQVGFCAVPMGRRYRFLTKLRSVCVLNREVDADKNKAFLEKMKATRNLPSNPLKRRVGYESCEDADEGPSKRTKTSSGTVDVDVNMQKLEI